MCAEGVRDTGVCPGGCQKFRRESGCYKRYLCVLEGAKILMCVLEDVRDTDVCLGDCQRY